jgi:hypothetical protein
VIDKLDDALQVAERHILQNDDWVLPRGDALKQGDQCYDNHFRRFWPFSAKILAVLICFNFRKN